MKKIFIYYLLAISTKCFAEPPSFSKIYLDNNKNVHAITLRGKNIKLTQHGRGGNATLSPDGKTAAWLVNNTWTTPENILPNASELRIYYNGKVRSIRCEPFIRDYWFWQKGKSIAIDCGSLHFAGTEILYSVATIKEIDRFNQAEIIPEERPRWSISSDKYAPNE
ncbi:hypothetical protein [Quatrionicoccus australiensis]|uniref:hypothetical protein n=1 Tax=Quatrionicoccus australiensis TaxID=138118 RepID=UPI001CFA602D|nr:hypothetical protein [Quatrionicoccus australiensis]MCB4359479.1 hypothetical protein [Quatrionicoccus australiensis]